MPKLPKATIDLTGVSIKQIMNLDLDINKLSRGDLSRVVGRLVSASNKRIRSLAKTEIGRLSPAYQSRMERGGEFSTRGKNTNQLRQLFGEAKGFLELKTSSVSKWKEVREEIAESLDVPKEFINSETKAKKFWKTYREIVDGKNIPDKKSGSKYNSERIQELIAERYGKKGGFKQKRSNVVEDVNKRVDELYEEEQEEDKSFDRTPDDIDVDEDDGFDIFDWWTYIQDKWN